jgi:hypothetical protein
METLLHKIALRLAGLARCDLTKTEEQIARLLIEANYLKWSGEGIYETLEMMTCGKSFGPISWVKKL